MRNIFSTMAILSAIFFTSQGMALTLNQDGLLTEWVGGEINNLGTEPATDVGSYTLLATWDGSNLYLGVDRDSSNRYLGDTVWTNDSFFIAIDTDGIAGSGADWDGYTRMQFNGPLKPDVIYYYAGGSGWYERGVWNGLDWDWKGWTDSGQYYGWSEANPNDELIPDLLAQAPAVSDANSLSVWAWMTRESNGFVECSWPRGADGFNGQLFGDPIVIMDEQTRLSLPYDPSPALYEEDVDGDTDLAVSFQSPLSPSLADPNVYEVDASVLSYKVYVSDALGREPNLVGPNPDLFLKGMVAQPGSGTLVSKTLTGFTPVKDARYQWRVDAVLDDTTERTGVVWTFYSEQTVPVINGITPFQIVDATATAIFTVDVTSVSTPTYQWYKDDGDGVVNPADTLLSGEVTDTLTITGAAQADEGKYYCVVSNDSLVEVISSQVPLGIKRKLAHWDFESANANSIVAGSPASVLVGDPAFVAAAGVAGDGMEFDGEVDGEDMLFTDANEVAYFDICNYQMTAACWVKTTNTKTWVPFVARNGEENGWQLRQSGFGGFGDRPLFTTRGVTGNTDGTSANRTINDGQWHYIVGTYDGAIKKVYIDGVVSRYYSTDDGSLVSEGDTVSGTISASPSSPVAIAGRVDGLDIERWNNCPGIYDEVKIFNYALDAETIAQTYATITGTDVCAGMQAYDLSDDCKVNMDDFALLASEWLNDELVQP